MTGGGLEACCDVSHGKPKAKAGPAPKPRKVEPTPEECSSMADLCLLNGIQKGEWGRASDIQLCLDRRANNKEICSSAFKAGVNITAHECGIDALVETKALQSLLVAAGRFADNGPIQENLQSVLQRFWEKAAAEQQWIQRPGPMAAARDLAASGRPECLGELHRVAVELHRAGASQVAGDVYNAVIEHYEKLLGPANASTLQARNNLAVLLEEVGKLEEAQQLHELVRKTCAESLAPDHPDALSSAFNLAALKAKQGKYQDAETLYRNVLEIRERVLGKDHGDTLRVKTNLAGVLRRQLKLKEAEALLTDVVDKRHEKKGWEDAEGLKSRMQLALVLMQQGRGQADKAEWHIKKVVEGRTKKLGKDHPETLAAMSHLAILMAEKQPAEAEELHQQVWVLLDGKVPEDRRRTPSLQNSLRSLDAPRAEAMLNEVYERRKRHLSADHPDVLVVRSEIASLMARTGRAADALRERREIAEVCERALGVFHVDTLAARVAVAQSLMQEVSSNQTEASEGLRAEAEKMHTLAVSRFSGAIEQRKSMIGFSPPSAANAESRSGKYAVLTRE